MNMISTKIQHAMVDFFKGNDEMVDRYGFELWQIMLSHLSVEQIERLCDNPPALEAFIEAAYQEMRDNEARE